MLDDIVTFGKGIVRTMGYGLMITTTSQNHIPNLNRKFCKMYEDLSFLLKKWLNNAKSQTRET